MPGVDSPVSFACIIPASLFAYGPVPGLELIPYFLGLLAWLAMAVLAVAWSPCAAALRRLRGKHAAGSPPNATGEEHVSGPC